MVCTTHYCGVWSSAIYDMCQELLNVGKLPDVQQIKLLCKLSCQSFAIELSLKSGLL